MDIQEFYELTLMDDGKTNSIKASEALEMAARWEMTNRPFAMAAPSSSGPSSKAPELVRPNQALAMPGKMKEELLGKLPELKPAIDDAPNSNNSR